MASESARSHPLVSVVMPSYNTAAYIRESIESVLSQDYANKELIVIDDGSTDGTVELVRAYGDAVRLITQHNQGSGAARNAGLAAARGDYIAFLDSDDVWLAHKLSIQVRYLEDRPDLGMIYSRWMTWKPAPDGRFPEACAVCSEPTQPTTNPGIVPQYSGWLYNRLLFGSLLHTITTMARRTLIDRIGPFDTEFKRGQDYDYWLRASRLTEIHKLDRVLALYRIHGEGCIKKWPNINYERIVLEKALSRWGVVGPNGEKTAMADVRRRLADICFDFGYHHYWEGDTRLATKSFCESATLRPARVATWRYIAMSLVKAFGQRPAPT